MDASVMCSWKAKLTTLIPLKKDKERIKADLIEAWNKRAE